MDRKIIANELLKMAKELLADTDYIYDPEHTKHPSGGYTKTEKGWTKNKKNDNGSNSDDNRKYRMTNQQIQLDDKSKSENVNVRKSVAKNSLSSRETLDRLSKDSNGDVRKNVALNKNTSMETLDRLSKDDDWGVRKGVAENLHTHEQTLFRLFDDENEIVHNSASENLQKRRRNHIVDMMKHRDKKDQEKLLEDEDIEERKKIMEQYHKG